jgi:hypothetical protein
MMEARDRMMKQMMDARNRAGAWGAPGMAFNPFGRSDRSRLGAIVESPSATLVEQLDLPKKQGLVIEDVQADSAAGKAGLKPHDILLELNGKAVSSDVSEFIRMLDDIKADKAVDAVVLRKGKRETIKGLTLPEAKKDNVGGFFPGGFPPGGVGGAGFAGGGGFGGVGGGGFVPPGGFPGGGGGIGLPGGFPGMPGMPGGAGGIGIGGMGGFGGKGVMTTTFRANDRFTTRHQEGSLVITVTGKVADGKATTSEILVQDGNESHKYESVDKVPERYRDKVKNLVDMTEKSNIKIEIK